MFYNITLLCYFDNTINQLIIFVEYQSIYVIIATHHKAALNLLLLIGVLWLQTHGLLSGKHLSHLLLGVLLLVLLATLHLSLLGL